MEKSFFEAFPNLKLEGVQRDLFEQVMVERITATRRRDLLRIYIRSERLIEKEQVYSVEREIKKQFFPREYMTIKIYEKFVLSEQYTPEKLMELYRESILVEIRECDHMLYAMFRQAEVQFPEEHTMELVLEDSVIAKSKEDELVAILDKVLNERCGFQIKFQIAYREARASKYREDDELRIQKIVEGISIRLGSVVRGNEAVAATDELSAPQAGGGSEPIRAATTKDAAASAGTERKANENKTFEKKTYEKKTYGRFEKGGDKGFQRRALKRSDNPNVIFGRDFEDESIDIEEIWGEMGEVTIRGKVRALETREIRNERTIVSFEITDFTDTIKVKMFVHNEQLAELTGDLKVGAFLKLKGVTVNDTFDRELTIGSVVGVMKIPDFTTARMDNSARKRVELHCHTKMSDMDGVSDVKDIIKRAKKWGHRALAITDHGCVQAFPDANHALDHGDDFKVIYGVEGYLVDDLKEIVTDGKGQTLDAAYVVFDIETTGFSPVTNRIIEIGAVKVENGQITDRFSAFVNPQVPIPFEIEKLTGISDSMVIDADTIEVILPRFLEFVGDAALVAHNASFDVGFIKENAKRQNIPFELTYVDTVGIARTLLTGQAKYTLDAVAKTLKISLENHHRAVDDAECTAEIFLKFIEMLKKDDIYTLEALNELGKASVDAVRKLHSYHIIILAKNQTGRINLYKLISESHLKYFYKRPLIPKSLIQKYREGLILGSACEAGELFGAMLDGQGDEQIARIVEFYDYLEIQPIGNNRFMIESERLRDINSEDDLIALNKRVVKLGEQFRKPVVATCDVHFLDPEDEVYRRIIMTGKGFKDADNQAPLYLRTTEEMLDEFAYYLGSEKAEEVVITNTNMIADMCDRIAPVRPDKCPPVIENSDQQLRDICYRKAHEMYGDDLPDIVEARLKRELDSIINNGFAVMYIIAQKLVWKSVEDGYLVGSRGSVGSSFVATMAGITEVNPLSPHYYCKNRHYSDFDSDEVKKFAGMAGCDMPDKYCPVCGEKLIKDGFDIPFETFLGFKGNKEPDIDLNFSGEYQSKAHKYTEVIFGYGQTFRAGTIGTLADKTAFGYVKNYYEERGKHKRTSEINRIVEGCVGVRRTTGQHPGGIVVLPVGEEIDSFTPVQHPANDMTTDTITTHFDYHSIDHNLLKLDILGHDDPTMIRMLQDLTGIDPTTIPLDDKEVMSLFQNTSALGITPEDIGGCRLGCLGIPEFGTDFAMQMVIDAQPKYFSDLVRISGLSHGTDVWLGNAQTLIQEGKATISTAICTRDDIMTYLIGMGLDSEESFKIMEAVRKGTVAKGKCGNWAEWKQDMLDHDVPDWYVWSCEKIQYMFPKAHAAAYVMMGWRIAYCKINYPLAYYCAFFSIRASAFSYETMCLGREQLERVMAEYRKRGDSLSNKEQDALKDMRIVQEMYARGFAFEPIDIFRAHSRNFQIVGDKVMPSLSSIEGLGDKAADAIMEAAKDGPFLSKDDFRSRTKVSKTVIDLMADLGLLGDIPESNQISLFDLVG
ncbi:MAG: PolC-type DNA polymerase III [Lachnospiraceae bacterium]|jgi:DNA polymerase-3 subunit alpha (Gram-positive type)|nr:PolC-type DNA polymerase III [Lachnospiraceae bacterium]